MNQKQQRQLIADGWIKAELSLRCRADSLSLAQLEQLLSMGGECETIVTSFRGKTLRGFIRDKNPALRPSGQ